MRASRRRRRRRAIAAHGLPSEPFARHEVSSCYVDPDARFVVALIVGYGPQDGVTTPSEAVRAALALTQDLGSLDTSWTVFDRSTGVLQVIEQGDVETCDGADIHLLSR
jgi:hypothetical protein